MIRYLVWRLLFEACNITRLFGHGPEGVQYMAFGANLSDEILKLRKFNDNYPKIAVMIFLSLIYKYSLTAFLIRR